MKQAPKRINQEWSTSKTDIFWGEIAPSNHLVQIYENDDVIINSLIGFITTGFSRNESVIIIATASHLSALNTRLATLGYDPDQMQLNYQYMPLNAEDALKKFIVNNWPDDTLFNDFVKGTVALAKGPDNRKVRAYGEMVALLWAKGHNGATVYLEHLWNRFCATEEFCLYCAYPKAGFTQDIKTSIHHICSTHTKLISGDSISTSEVFYKDLKSH